MHATTIIAYAYDADIHCDQCAYEYVGGHVPNENDKDFKGNEVYPVFASDEWWEPSDNEPQSLVCSDCDCIIARFVDGNISYNLLGEIYD